MIVLPPIAVQGTYLKIIIIFERNMETEADEIGLSLASRACLDVREAPAFWARMAVLEKDQEQPPELLSTHPAHESRQQHLLDLLPQVKTKINSLRAILNILHFALLQGSCSTDFLWLC